MPVPFDKKFINDVGKGIEKLAVEKMHKLALHTHYRLVYATPKDIGQAQGSWNFTLNRVDPSYPPIPADGSQVPPAASIPDKVATNAKDVYHISNSVPHIIYLNEGHSGQAAANFVQREILIAVKDVEKGIQQ